MGIPSLLKILKTISTKKPLYLYKGKKAGIDGYTWLHRSLYCIGDGILQYPIDITRSLIYFTKKLNLLLYNEITPIFVFDGDKLPMKINEEDKRENKRKEHERIAEELLSANDIYRAIFKKIESFDVTPEFAYEFMKILKHYNVEYIVAPYEADAQLAYLSKINYIDLIITEDSDLLAYGCKCVLYKLGTIDKEPLDVGEEIIWDDIKNCKEIYFKNFNENKFLSFCILCGCDYFKLSGVGPKLSNEAVNKSDDYNKILGFIMNKNIIKGSILETIEKFEKTFLTFKYQVVYCPLEKKMRYFNDINDPCCPFLDKYKNDLSFLGIIQNNNLEKYIKGEINPITKENINENNPSFVYASNIYERAQGSNNILRTEEDEMFVRDDQSDSGEDDRGNFVSKKNFFKKLSKMKIKKEKKPKKLEIPKNQITMEAFFDKNNKFRELKKTKRHFKRFRRHKKNKNKKNENEDETKVEFDEEYQNKENNNDENNINSNIFNNYTFDINKNQNIENNVPTHNDIEIYRSKIYNNEKLVDTNLSNLKPAHKKEPKKNKEKKIIKKKKKKKKIEEEEEEEIQIHIKMEDLEPKVEKINMKIEKKEPKEELEKKQEEEKDEGKDNIILNDFGYSENNVDKDPNVLNKPRWIKKVNKKPEKEKDINIKKEDNIGKKPKKIKKIKKKEEKEKKKEEEKERKKQEKEKKKKEKEKKKEEREKKREEKEIKKKEKEEKKLLKKKRKRSEEDDEEKQEEEKVKKMIREDPNMKGLDLYKNSLMALDQF